MVIYLDTETTDLRPGSICQLSYVMQNGEEIKAKNFFFTVDYVNPSAENVHGFSVEKLEKLSGGKDFSCFINEIEKDLDSADVVVMHNAPFDTEFLKREFYRCNRDLPIKRTYCSMKNSVNLLKIPRFGYGGYKYPKLSELCAYFGISPEDIDDKTKELYCTDVDFHDARFDTAALFLAVNRGIRLDLAFTDIKEFL